MTPDQINGAFEVFGGFTSWANVLLYLRDRKVAGVYWPATFFYVTWGVWNLFYYPSLDQIWSFWGGLFLTLGSTTWLALVVKDKILNIRGI